MFFCEYALAYHKPQFTDLWQSLGHNLYHNFMKRGEKSARECHIMITEIGLHAQKKQ